jgi:hypothetical protein
MTLSILAYFPVMADARTAAEALRQKGYPVKMDPLESDLPDSDYSVSELMVGFLPDLSHGIFGSGSSKINEGDGALLFVVVDDPWERLHVMEIITRYGGLEEAFD